MGIQAAPSLSDQPWRAPEIERQQPNKQVGSPDNGTKQFQSRLDDPIGIERKDLSMRQDSSFNKDINALTQDRLRQERVYRREYRTAMRTGNVGAASKALEKMSEGGFSSSGTTFNKMRGMVVAEHNFLNPQGSQQQQAGLPVSRETFQQTEDQKRQELTLSGAFGTTARDTMRGRLGLDENGNPQQAGPPSSAAPKPYSDGTFPGSQVGVTSKPTGASSLVDTIGTTARSLVSSLLGINTTKAQPNPLDFKSSKESELAALTEKYGDAETAQSVYNLRNGIDSVPANLIAAREKTDALSARSERLGKLSEFALNKSNAIQKESAESQLARESFLSKESDLLDRALALTTIERNKSSESAFNQIESSAKSGVHSGFMIPDVGENKRFNNDPALLSDMIARIRSGDKSLGELGLNTEKAKLAAEEAKKKSDSAYESASKISRAISGPKPKFFDVADQYKKKKK